MPGNLTYDARRLALDFVYGNDPTPPVLPLQVRLMLTMGSPEASDAGDEVTGDLYQPADLLPGAATLVSTTVSVKNVDVVYFEGIDSSSTVVVEGYEIWDSAIVPVRLAYEQFSSPISVPAGEDCQFAVNALSHELG